MRDIRLALRRRTRAAVLGVLTTCGLAACGGGGGGGGGGGDAPGSADLSALAVSSGVLQPAFAAATVTYTVGPAPLPTSVTVTATAALPDATLTIAGVPTPSGTPSANLALAPGPTPVAVVVTSASGQSQRTYTVTFDRTTADLAALVVSAGSLTPAFDANVTAYAVGPALTVWETTITATPADPGATLTVDGVPVANGVPSGELPLGPRSTAIPVVVYPRAGPPKTYTVTLDRSPALFFDDFTDGVLGPWWGGTGTIDDGTGSPLPSLALEQLESVTAIDDSFATGPGVTVTVMVQRDTNARARVTLEQAGQPANRWLWFELAGATFHAQYGNNGSVVQDAQGPVPADDNLFHLLQVKIDAAGQATFTWNGVLYVTINGVAAGDMTLSLEHPVSAAAPGQLARFDEVAVTSP